jgi:hypothetical protein
LVESGEHHEVIHKDNDHELVEQLCSSSSLVNVWPDCRIDADIDCTSKQEELKLHVIVAVEESGEHNKCDSSQHIDW